MVLKAYSKRIHIDDKESQRNCGQRNGTLATGVAPNSVLDRRLCPANLPRSGKIHPFKMKGPADDTSLEMSDVLCFIDTMITHHAYDVFERIFNHNNLSSIYVSLFDLALVLL